MTTTEADRASAWAHWKSLIGALASAAFLFGAVQALSPTSAEAMIRQETQEECEASGGWWEWHFGACITFDDDSGGGSGGDGGTGGGGGFGSGGDNPGSPDGSWDSPGDDGLKDPLNPECFELETSGGTYELCPTGEPEIINETGDPEEDVWDPETDRPRGPVIARRHGRHGRHEVAKMKRRAHRAKARAHRR